ncbi:MAG TPA: hypothetical protein P5514_11460 [Bacteroidales bacterium]|nr:hypothetical protein [Bacteroidales bacterium]HRX97555.1 hypothetical protein [Bacteroidales bacterium]
MKSKLLIIIIVNSISIIHAQNVIEVSYSDTSYTYILFERCLKDSLPDGQYMLYFPTEKHSNESKIKEIAHYKNNVRDGIHIEYGINEDIYYLHKLEYYKNGILDGQSLVFYLDGSIILSGFFHDGKRIGKWQWKREKGNYILNYNEFGNITSWQCFDDSNKLLSEGEGSPGFIFP